MSIYYTGKGDGGESRVGRKKYPKTIPEFAALGDLDELNSLLGLVKNRTSPPTPPLLRKERGGENTHFSQRGEVNGKYLFYIIECIQQDLFIIQAHIGSFWFEKKYKPPNFSHDKIRILEKHITRFEKKLPPLNKFVVPGTNEFSAWLDYARAVSRRAERSILAHHAKHPLHPAILSYCNRLSSFLFVLARAASAQSEIQEQHPHYDKR